MEDGTLKPGDPAPSITVLAALHGYSRGTCAKAMRLLEQAGILRNVPGHGYYRTAPDSTGTR